MQSIISKTKFNNPLYLIGQGFTNCIIPSFIKQHFLGNPHVYSAYTPYQAEISQGRLELLYNYQTIIEDITNMDIAVASLIDNGQVGMDLITLMKQKTKKNRIFIQSALNIPLINCLQTRARHQNIDLHFFDDLNSILNMDHSIIKNSAGIIIQNPDIFGTINNISLINEIKDINKKMFVACHTNLMFLSKFDGQVDSGIDFMFGNGGNMGVGLNYGGPQPAFLSSKKEHIRLLPGRIIGKTIDANNKESFRMTLQTREQHIRKEKATSNVCTSQALLANMSAAWCMYHGNNGLKNISNNIYKTTNIFYENIKEKGYNVHNTNFFDTITLEVENNNYLYNKLQSNNIFTYKTKEDNNKLSFTFDETHNEDTIEFLLHYIKKNNESIYLQNKVEEPINERTNDIIKNVNTLSDEQKTMRYLHNLQLKDYSMMNGLIPLGSCTMKHTPHEAMNELMQPKWNIHPYIPIIKTPHKKIIDRLTKNLCKLSGFNDVFYQSQSGAMGEYAGLTTIKNYLNNDDRNVILLPRSAHGTNPASCVLAGYKPIYINEIDDGNIDMEHFSLLIEENKDNLAGLMITYPSTYGLYEPNIKLINKLIHKHGGQVYLDGANMNALVGLKFPVATLGFDVCHFNLHKTFCIPHGGGGPGMGPIAVKEHLKNYLPKFSYECKTESISTSNYGSGSLLVIPDYYVNSKPKSYWKEHHEHLLNTTDKIIKKLSPYYKIFHENSNNRAHEFIIDCSEIKKNI